MYGRWIDAQPDGLYVARSETGVEAFALHVYVSPEDNPVPEDPVVRAVLDAIARRSPLRPGERVGICRALGNRGAYQRDALAVLAGSVSSLVEWLSRPVAWTVVTAPHEDFWRPFFEYLGFGVLARMRFGAGDVTAYGWDRRRLPLAEFLELTGRRELTGETGPPPAELLRPAPLGREAFEEAVRAALRDLNRPDRLAASPLAGTALGPDLRASLLAGIARLGDEPKGEPLRRVLTGRTCAGRRARRRRRRCSACRSAPTGGTWPGPPPGWSTCSGRSKWAPRAGLSSVLAWWVSSGSRDRPRHGRHPRPRGRPDRPDHRDAARPGRPRRDRAGARRRRSAARARRRRPGPAGTAAGVAQFHQLHLMLPRWREVMETELPGVLDALRAAGGLDHNVLHHRPVAQTGGWQPGDERFGAGHRPAAGARGGRGDRGGAAVPACGSGVAWR